MGMTIVTGSVGSGKSTYVKLAAKEKDSMVFDYDNILMALGPNGTSRTKPSWAFAVMEDIRRYLQRYSGLDLWIIQAMPKKFEKEYFAKKYGAKIIVINPGIEKCKQNIQQDKGRPDKLLELKLIDEWYAAYEPYIDEQIITNAMRV